MIRSFSLIWGSVWWDRAAKYFCKVVTEALLDSLPVPKVLVITTPFMNTFEQSVGKRKKDCLTTAWWPICGLIELLDLIYVGLDKGSNPGIPISRGIHARVQEGFCIFHLCTFFFLLPLQGFISAFHYSFLILDRNLVLWGHKKKKKNLKQVRSFSTPTSQNTL